MAGLYGIDLEDNALALIATHKEVDRITDRSGDKKHGTVTGATWTYPAARNQLHIGVPILNFDGVDDFVAVGRMPVLEGTAATWSIEFWYRATDVDTDLRCLFAYEDDDALGTASLYAYVRSNLRAIRYQIGGGGVEIDTTSREYEDLAWHHYVFGKTATNAILIVDGVEKYNAAHNGDNYAADYVFRFGDNYNVAHAKGDMAFMRIRPGAPNTHDALLHISQERHLLGR